MIRRPPGSTRTYTHFPYTTLFRVCMAPAGALTKPIRRMSPLPRGIDRIRGHFAQKELFNRNAIIVASRARAAGGRGAAWSHDGQIADEHGPAIPGAACPRDGGSDARVERVPPCAGHDPDHGFRKNGSAHV